MAVLCEASLKFQQITVFQMPDPVKTMGQQVAAVGDHQQGALIGIDQIPQTVQVFKIQENIRLVHDQQTRTAEHLADDLHQLQFAAT